MAVITSFLTVNSSGLNSTSLFITDPYGNVQCQLDLDQTQTHNLAAALLQLCPVDVEAVEVTEQETEQVLKQATDWEALTKAEIIERVFDDHGVELYADDRKADLVAQAQDLERQAA
jgi:hypothetical protein